MATKQTTANVGREINQDTTTMPAIDLRRFVISVTIEGKQHQLDPVGIAREAEQADITKETARQKGVRFGDHLLKMASLCNGWQEFEDVLKETQRQLNWGRGRERATPRTFSVYASTIKRGMKAFGLVPLAEIEIPSADKGQLTRTESGEVITERVRLDGISAFKRAIDRFALAERDSKSAVEDRRSAARTEAERLKSAGFISAEAEQSVTQLLWTFKHMRDDDVRAKLVEGLNKLLGKYPSPEPFPQKAVRSH